MSHSVHIFVGRTTDVPVVKTIPSGVKVANFSVACDRDIGDETDYHDVVAWRGLAETIEKYLGKGRLVLVEGRPQHRKYKVTREGVEFTQNVTEIVATKVQFLDSPRSAESSTPSQQPQSVPYSDDDLPF
jgi:single-strand DNA-binding protein